MKLITSMEALKSELQLTEQELCWKEDGLTVPLSITDYYFNLIDKDDPNDPLRKQVVPSVLENNAEVYEDMDPLEEVKHSITSRLVHRYENRVAFLVTDICPMYCRHCFRRRFTGNMVGPATENQIIEAAKYVGSHPKIKEILLTGGDVLTLSNNQIDFLLKTFREYQPKLLIRLCTRYLTSYPDRIDEELISILRKYDTAPIFIMVQFNHPKELTDKSKAAIKKLTDAGFFIFDQTVLLKGVNDDPKILSVLFEELLLLKVKPYYLFQGDLVSGTSHFRVPLQEGLKIYKEVANTVSGLALPTYALDLPHGAGKASLGTASITETPNYFIITSPEGNTVSYPKQ